MIVSNKITTYEIASCPKTSKEETISLESHQNNHFMTITIGKSKALVRIVDVETALQNIKNRG